VAVSAAAFALASPLAATASIGTGIGANPLRLVERADPGGHYRLPSLYVVNTGTQAADYLVRVKRLGAPTGHDVPVSWVRFTRTRIRLRPHQSAIIPAVLIVPKGAAHGDYRSNVVVGTWTPHRGRGAALGAAAADELSFTIGKPGGGFPWSSPWLLYSVLGLGLAGLLTLLLRRSGLHVRIERTQ